jgi:TetR/AcrR family transcriptional regulator, transcriptional repressor for nem operon
MSGKVVGMQEASTLTTRQGPRGESVRPDTVSRALDVAERLVQVRGFNGFSYADVAGELQITKASLHYHFPGKAALGEALIVRYTERFVEALHAIGTGVEGAPARLTAYADLYARVLADRRMCLCGMLAAEYETLPRPMQRAVTSFFDQNEAWLARVLLEGRRRGEVRFTGSGRELARAVIAALEGGMLVSRPFSEPARFQAIARRLVAALVPQA